MLPSPSANPCLGISSNNIELKQVRPFGNLTIESPEDQTINNDTDRLERGPEEAKNLEQLPTHANEVPHPSITGDSPPQVIDQLITSGGECDSTLTNNVDLVGHIAAASMQGIEDSQKWPKVPIKQEVMEIIRRRSSPIESTQPFFKRSPGTPPSDVNNILPADGGFRELEQTDDSEAQPATGAERIDSSERSSWSKSYAPVSHRLSVEMKEKTSPTTILNKVECSPSDLSTTNVRVFQVLEPQISGGTALHMVKETSSRTGINNRRLEPEDTQRQMQDLNTNGTAQDHSEPFAKRESIPPSRFIAAEDGTPNLDALDALSEDMMNAAASLLQPGEEVLDSQNSRVREGRSFGDYIATLPFSSQTGNEDPLIGEVATVVDYGISNPIRMEDYGKNTMPLGDGLLQIVSTKANVPENTSTAIGDLDPLSATVNKQDAHGKPRAREDDKTTGEDSQDEIPPRPSKRAKTSFRTRGENKQPSNLPLSNISSIQETPKKRHDANGILLATTPMTRPHDTDSIGSTVEVRIPKSLRKPRTMQPSPGSEQQQSKLEPDGTPISSGSSVRTRKSIDTASSLISPSEKSSLKILYASSTNVDNLRSVMKVLTKHGVRQVQKVADCDYLCVGHGKELKKTGRLILAVAMGKYVISDEWAKKSAEHGRLLNPQDYLATDPVREKEWGTGLTEACERGQTNAKPLLGRKILFTPFVWKDLGKGFGELKDIAKQTGATLIQARLPRSSDQNNGTLIISSDLDPDLDDLSGNGWRCFTTDIITVSVLRGVVDPDSDEFSLTAGRTSQESGRKKRKRQP